MKEARMPVYVGVDFHVRQQTIYWMDTADGEMRRQVVYHDPADPVQAFYQQLPRPAGVGLESSGYAQWFHRLVEE